MSGRGVLTRFALFLTIAGLGLVTWGPLTIGAGAHQYADARPWAGVPNAANVLINLPTFWLAVWGWCATRTSPWPRNLRLPWQCFQLCVMAGALSAAMYHAAPDDRLFVVSHTCMAGAFVTLSLGLLAERVDTRFGSIAICTGSVLAVALIGAWTGRAGMLGSAFDLRPLLLLELIPLLLLSAGVLRLPSTPQVHSSGWAVVLALYASSKLFGWTDAGIFHATGWISGHTLMHLAIALLVGWTTYRAVATPGPAATGAASSGLNHRQASVNTSG